jgi:uncharacterized protein (DUF488 family)
MKNVIYTVGHSNRTQPEFIALLKYFKIQALVDVRRYPGSQRFPHFDQENLKMELKNQGLLYFWLGDLLGGFRTGGYEDYLQTMAYKKGIQKIAEIASRLVSSIFCAEKNFGNCHRIHISETLFADGYPVLHILSENEIIDQQEVVERRQQNQLSQLNFFDF